MNAIVTRGALALLRLLARLPLPVLRALGTVLGHVLYVLAVPRRRIALRNLALCFPQMDEARRRDWARQNFVRFCQSFLDRGWLWTASPEVLRQRVRLSGAVQALDDPAPVVLCAPHFYGLEAGGVALSLHTQREFTSIYAAHPNPVLDAWLMAGRQRFGRLRMFNRGDGVQPVLANLRKGGMLYLLPDMDYGLRDSLFVPFFAVPQTATITSLARFARLGRARVLGLYCRMTATGYEVQLTDAWAHYPSGDLMADTARMNREIEAAILTMPEQYYWVHRRFKTRPEGADDLYR